MHISVLSSEPSDSLIPWVSVVMCLLSWILLALLLFEIKSEVGTLCIVFSQYGQGLMIFAIN